MALHTHHDETDRRDYTGEELAIKEAVGYHNYFRIGTSEASDRVQECCPDGWMAVTWIGGLPLPAGAIRVGQVRVHHGDPDYPIYVYPRVTR